MKDENWKTMKPSEEKKDTLFEFTKTLTDMSQRGNLYGRLLELKDLELHIQKRINELEKQIEETDPLKQQKGGNMTDKKALEILFNAINFNVEITKREVGKEIIKANKESWEAYDYIKQKIERSKDEE